MRFAHLTDLHLPIPAAPGLAQLMSKRALGYLSWTRNRQYRHRPTALDALIKDLAGAGCDFTVITGDLINIALPAEFAAAARWLDDCFAPDRTSFTPGNHDAYVATSWREGPGSFDRFMRGVRSDDAAARAPADADDFPFVRNVGEIAFIMANSSPPTAPGLATGRLGAAQIARIGAELRKARADGKCRVLALHHPVTQGATPRRKALDDGADLRALLEREGVELVLHGHTHRTIWASVMTPDGARPVAGGASASHGAAHGHYRPARYTIFEAARPRMTDGAGWRIDATVRELDPATGAVVTAETRQLLPANPAQEHA